MSVGDLRLTPEQAQKARDAGHHPVCFYRCSSSFIAAECGGLCPCHDGRVADRVSINQAEPVFDPDLLRLGFFRPVEKPSKKGGGVKYE